MPAQASPPQRIFDAIGAQLVLSESFGAPRPRVGEDYEITSILGAGGFGLICRATNISLRRDIALKLFPLGGEGDSGVREALREARSLARLEHPGIVAVHAAGESEVITDERLPCAFVEMQLVAGETLRTWLEPGRNANTVLDVLLEAGRALASAHQSGLVHRDFKPENLMVDQHGKARVIDFGLALAADSPTRDSDQSLQLADWSPHADALGARATQAGRIRGTPGYMAPEAAQGQPRAASDQFALAVVIREALTGRHPFAHEGPPTSVPAHEGRALFEQLQPLLDRAMSPAPSDRFGDIAQLCDALETEAYPDSTPGTKPARVAVLVVAVLVMLAAGLLARQWLRAKPATPPRTDLPAATTPAPQARPEPPSSQKAETPPPEPEPSLPPEPGTPPSCTDLEAWAGLWQVGGKVAWTEFSYQLQWRLEYEIEIRVGERCMLTVVARRYPPMIEGEIPGQPITSEATGVAVFEAGVWRLPLRLEFADDGQTYGAVEHYETMFVLDRLAQRERIQAGFRRLNAKGFPIRTGMLLGARGAVPDLRTLVPEQLPCAARCRLECAGDIAERECRKLDCVALEADGPLCGVPSRDFDIPMRALVTHKELLKGHDIMQDALARSGPKHLAKCPRNAQALAGRWFVGASGPPDFAREALALEIVAEGCQLSGSATSADTQTDPQAFTGYVTGAGTWVLEPTQPQAWFPATLVLTGVGEHSPAFGSDGSQPPHMLRARKLP